MPDSIKDGVNHNKVSRKSSVGHQLSKSDEARKKLGVINPYSRTYGPIKVGVGQASSGIKKA